MTGLDDLFFWQAEHDRVIAKGGYLAYYCLEATDTRVEVTHGVNVGSLFDEPREKLHNIPGINYLGRGYFSRVELIGERPKMCLGDYGPGR